MDSISRPVCGGGSASGEYNTGIHVLGLFIVLVASIASAGFPILARNFSGLRIPAPVFFFCKHFGTGVIIATAFVHLLPTAFLSLNDPCLPKFFTDDYPALPGVMALAAVFVLFAIDLWMHYRLPDMLDHHNPHANLLSRGATKMGEGSSKHPIDEERADQNIESGEIDAKWDYITYKKMSMEVTLLEAGILFHSVFVGMTVSITTDGYWVLLVAIIFHQIFEGLGLGSRIAAVPWRSRSRPWLLVVGFGLTAPLGQAIGIAARRSWDPESIFALILVGTFNAISAGLLEYAGLVNLLHSDFLSQEARATLATKKKSLLAFAYVLLGAIGMSIVGAFA